MFDVDGSGKIDMFELSKILQGEGGERACSNAEIMDYIK
jgi:Ca2+-binding EF-hand superfamily protein